MPPAGRRAAGPGLERRCAAWRAHGLFWAHLEAEALVAVPAQSLQLPHAPVAAARCQKWALRD